MLGSPEATDHFEINMARADWLMIVSLRAHVVQVKANRVTRQLLEVRSMLEQPHSFLEIRVPSVVPVTNRCIRAEARNELGVIRIKRQLIEFLPVFKTKL